MRKLSLAAAAQITQAPGTCGPSTAVWEPMQRGRRNARRVYSNCGHVINLARVGIDEELVGVESVAEGVDVGEEAGVGALGPAGAIGPVGSPSAVAVLDGAGDAGGLHLGYGDDDLPGDLGLAGVVRGTEVHAVDGGVRGCDGNNEKSAYDCERQ